MKDDPDDDICVGVSALGKRLNDRLEDDEADIEDRYDQADKRDWIVDYFGTCCIITQPSCQAARSASSHKESRRNRTQSCRSR